MWKPGVPYRNGNFIQENSCNIQCPLPTKSDTPNRYPLHQSIRCCSKRIPGRCHRWFPLMIPKNMTNFIWISISLFEQHPLFLLKSKLINFPQHHFKKAGPKVQKPSCNYNQLHKVHQILKTPTQKKKTLHAWVASFSSSNCLRLPSKNRWRCCAASVKSLGRQHSEKHLDQFARNPTFFHKARSLAL